MAVELIDGITLDLRTVYGVDLDNATITPHPTLAQFKKDPRDGILESLHTTTSWDETPPIEVVEVEPDEDDEDDRTVGIVDGYTRSQMHLEKYIETGDETWLYLRAFPYVGGDAVIDALARNYEGTRSNLSDAEYTVAIKALLESGKTPEEIAAKLGGESQHHRLLKKITDILNAEPAVAHAVIHGAVVNLTADETESGEEETYIAQIDATSAAQIAREVAPENQKEAVQAVAKAVVLTGGDQTAARKETGLRESKHNMQRLNEIISDAVEVYELYEATELLPEEDPKDPSYGIQLEVYIKVLKLNAENGFKTRKQVLNFFKTHLTEKRAKEDAVQRKNLEKAENAEKKKKDKAAKSAPSAAGVKKIEKKKPASAPTAPKVVKVPKGTVVEVPAPTAPKPPKAPAPPKLPK